MDRSFVNVEPNIHGLDVQHTKYTHYFYIGIGCVAVLLLILVFYYVTKKKEVPALPNHVQQFYRGPVPSPVGVSTPVVSTPVGVSSPVGVPTPVVSTPVGEVAAVPSSTNEDRTVLETKNAPLDVDLDDPESTHSVVYTPSLEEVDETKESVYNEAIRNDFSFEEDN